MLLGKRLTGEPFNLDDDTRARHVHIVGQTGTGKSALLANLIAADLAAGNGVAVIDPHGELAEQVLGLVPPSRFKDVRYLNPADDRPVPFNPLHGIPLPQRPAAADAILSAFRAVWGWTPETAPRALPLLRNAIRTALDMREPTFLDVMRIVDGSADRRKATDPLNRAYWERLESRDARYQQEATDPVLTRLDALLTPPVRAVLCQRPTFDLAHLMNEGQILVCNLDKSMGELNSHLLGAFIVSGIVQAAMHRPPSREAGSAQFHQRQPSGKLVSIAEEMPTKLKPFYLYADEFQNFATDSFSSALSEARKKGLSITIAHQYTQQVPESLMSAVLGNTGSTICFRVGAEDAPLLASHLGSAIADHDLNPRSLKELPNFECVARVLSGGVPTAVRLKTLPPPAPLHDRTDKLVKNSRTRFGRPAALVEQAISRSLTPPRPKKRARIW